MAAGAVAVFGGSSASAKKPKADYVIGVSNTLVGNGWRDEMICAAKAQALASGKVAKVVVVNQNQNGAAADRVDPQPDLAGRQRDRRQPGRPHGAELR